MLNGKSLSLFCRNNFKASGSPAQMTIFYAGTVNVFDDISPEKVLSLSLSQGFKILSLLSPLLGCAHELRSFSFLFFAKNSYPGSGYYVLS